MKGKIKAYFADKNFGFIVDYKGDEYFFHSSKIVANKFDKIKKGMSVTFDAKSTSKGMSAENIEIVKESKKRYILPDTVYTSKQYDIKGWKTLFRSKYTLHMTDRGNPKSVKKKMMKVAEQVGANAILNLSYIDEEGEESGEGSGTHYFTIHHFYGELAFIGKKSESGRIIDKQQLKNIDVELLASKESIEKEYTASNGWQMFVFFAAIAFALYLNVDVIKGEASFYWGSLVLPGILLAILLGDYNDHEKCWIEEE